MVVAEKHIEKPHIQNERNGSIQNISQSLQSKTNEILNKKCITKQKLKHTVKFEE